MGLEYNFEFASESTPTDLLKNIAKHSRASRTEGENFLLLPGLKVFVEVMSPFETQLAKEGRAGIPATRRLSFRLTDYSVPDLEAGIVRVIDYILGREKGDGALMSLGDGPPDLIRKNGDLVLYDNIDSEKDFFDRPDMRALLTHPYRVVKRKGRFAKA